jgi:hypothetical protein
VTLRFDWYSKFDHQVINTKAKIILDLLIKDGNWNATKEKTELATKQILSALYWSYFSFPKNTSKVSISLTSGHYSNTEYSYHVIKKVFDCLCDLKWIEFEKGSENKKRVTRIWAVGELSLTFDAIGLLWLSQEPKPEQSLVVLRDYRNPEGKTKKARGDKVDLEVPETNVVSTYRSNLYSYNQFLLQHCVSLELDDENLNQLAEEIVKRSKDETRAWSTEAEEKVGCLDFSRTQLRRIFSRGSLEKGGRFYGGWWQGIPSIHRPHIRIDGYKTIEVDYSSMSLRIIYAQRGINMPPEDDLYDIGLPDWLANNDPRRKPIKIYVNAILNDETGSFCLSKEEQKSVGVGQEELKDRVFNRHSLISDLFNSGEGLNAQFIDSQIAEFVMMEMMRDEFLVLPIHDSFIVRLGHRAFIHDTMQTAFKHFTGASVGLSETIVKGNDHYGMSDEEVNELAKDPANSVVSLAQLEDEIFKEPTIMSRYQGSWEVQRQLL